MEKLNEMFDNELRKKYKIKPYYSRKYLKQYGIHLLACIIIILSVLGYVVKLTIESEIYKYKTRWSELRCNPQWIPFAHLISPETGKTAEEINSENLAFCSSEVLGDVVEVATEPARESIRQLTNIESTILETHNTFRNILDETRER